MYLLQKKETWRHPFSHLGWKLEIFALILMGELMKIQIKGVAKI